MSAKDLPVSWRGTIVAPQALTRQKVLELASRMYRNGLGPDAVIYTGSPHEWTLRDAVCDYAWLTPGVSHAAFRAALAFGNLRLIQREFVEFGG